MSKEKELIKKLNASYNSVSKIEKLKKEYFSVYNNLKFYEKIFNISLLKKLKKLDVLKEKYNKEFIKNEIDKYSFLFDNINGYKLDIHQRKAIVKDPDNLLIVAGAGSGKTLTLIGKIMYLLYKKVNSSKILCVSFTNESANNLKNTLLKNNIDIKVTTFHKLGLDILKDNGYFYEIAKDTLLKEVIEKESEKIYPLIEEKLITINQYGQRSKPCNIIKKSMISKSEYLKSYQNLIFTFINLFKGNGYSNFDLIYKKMKKDDKTLQKRNRLLIDICKDIYFKYEEKLKMLNQIDFNDMIVKAINMKKYKEYEYILVDEFQDTSKIRCDLLKKIQKKTKVKIVAVGDDFQSIYRFTGCTLDNFVNFGVNFKGSEVAFIPNTYRNSQELIKLTSKFITKNNLQIKKNLNSVKCNEKPIKVYYYNKSYKEVINKVLSNINSQDVLILGRNNKDVINCKAFIKNSKARIMTVHKSKGLESENVIILNLEDNFLGFPNKINDDPILKYVLPRNEKYLYAEERRLFYVALTRTKNNVYLLVNKNNPSIFVSELLKDSFNYIEVKQDICDKCGGILVKRKGKYGEFYGCSNYPKCKFIAK